MYCYENYKIMTLDACRKILLMFFIMIYVYYNISSVVLLYQSLGSFILLDLKC